MSDFSLPRKRGLAPGLRLALSPGLVLALTVAALAALLTRRIVLPLGPMYWDLYIYLDAANRIFDGQVPSVDFFPPVGPLGYWLFAAGMKLFPTAHPLLVVDWSLLAVTAPLMALVVADVDRRSRPLAFALLLPFLFFSVLPYNKEVYYSYVGIDGYGLYNRQGDRLLYVLAAGLIFSRGAWRGGIVIAGTMLALFLTKITGFIAGGCLCAFALAAGRVRPRVAIGSALAVLAALLGLELRFGVVSAYLKDIEQLVAINEGGLVGRFFQAASIHFDVFVPCMALAAVLVLASRASLLRRWRRLAMAPLRLRLAVLFDRPGFWIGACGLAGLFFETQNTGSQVFILVWPAVLRASLALRDLRRPGALLAAALAAATVLPTPIGILARAARTMVAPSRYVPLDTDNLGVLGLVSQRGLMIDRADKMLALYARHGETFDDMRREGVSPSFALTLEPDFHLTYLKAVDQAVDAVRLLEMAEGLHFETIMNLNFVNPFPWLLGRHATKHISIGADPERTIPPPNAETAAAIRATDLLLYPKCPVMAANAELLALYRPFLDQHRRVELTPCWDAYLRSGLKLQP
ncbi:hypothetical protein GCM10011390_01470 [Aureimonas endophytica]|uniref:Uncharacterized protein n=1 Tax=Aureimonas endophytica TaxID=2027858 RepID=A0A916ZBI3_9HYPH|nr:hypothetical protein [Aureimonas endophytica]GGD86550.1 hypothetical protein GCM10011390_01470 [Aureimonas endophytica]